MKNAEFIFRVPDEDPKPPPPPPPPPDEEGD
jgi:hypothetical protein